MSKRIKYEDYKAIHELKAQGFNKYQASLKLQIRKPTIYNYWDISEEEYFRLSYDAVNNLEQYKQFLTEMVKANPTIKDKVLLSRIREEFNGTEIKQATFYRYITKLREELGLERKNVRNFMLVEHRNPGEVMQVDMGEKIMTDMYGNKQKVYFVAFILSYSRMKFGYFSNKPFTTQTFIKAHEYAFKYFCGRTQMIMYDQAKILVFDETAGNIIFIKEFEEYIKHTGFAVYLCKKRDPSTKGQVENAVRIIKMNFMESREYCGINNLNSQALKWLDDFCNATLNRHTLKTPEEMFETERKHMIKVKAYKTNDERLSVLDDANTILYKNNRYSLPIGIYKKGEKVIVRELVNEIHILDTQTNILVCSHALSKGKGEIIQGQEFSYSTTSEDHLIKLLGNDERILKLIDGIRCTKPRYIHEQCILLKRISDNFTSQEFFEGVEHCIGYRKCCATEVIVYLVMKYGIERVAKAD